MYGEAAYGFARNHQVLLNVADGKRIALFVGDDPFDLSTGALEAYERSLDLRTGILTRTVRWRSPGGPAVDVVARRLVSLARPEIAAIDFAVTLVDGRAAIRIVSGINARVRNQEAAADPRVGAHLPEGALQTAHHEAAGTFGAVVQRTRTTRLAIVAATDHVVRTEGVPRTRREILHGRARPGIALTLDATLAAGESLGLTKLLAYCTSPRPPRGGAPRARARRHRAVPRSRVRRARGRAARRSRPLLEHIGRRDRRGRGAAAGCPVQPVQPVPVGRPRRPHEPRREGPVGRGLRGPLLLGHRDLRAAVLRLHAAGDRAGPAALPLRDPGQGTRPSRGDEPARRALPVADDRRRGGLGLLPGRHRPVPHQRGHRVCHREVRRRQRRPVAAARRRRRGRVRDRAAVGRPRRLHPRPRRGVLHQRGHGSGRVHGAGQQQRLHEPDGPRAPAVRRAARGRAGGRRARGLRPARRADRAGRRRGGRVAARRRPHAHPAGRRAWACMRRTTRSSTAPRGRSRRRRPRTTRSSSTTTRW